MNRPIAIGLLVFLTAQNGFCQSSTDVNRYIDSYKDIAISEMQRTGVPAAITLAQGIHETLAGTSELVRKSNNHFGIKCKEGWRGAVVYHDDDRRGECFRGYDSPSDSYRDHSDFLRNSPRYGFLFKIDPTDYDAWAHGLKKAGYATNIHYADILIRLINNYQLQQYSLIALGRLRSGGEGNSSGDDAKNESGIRSTPGEQGKKDYPAGEFLINRTRVIFAKAGVSLLGIAEQYGITLSRLLDFNDLGEEDILGKAQLLFLQRKRKLGADEFHIVQPGESLYDISQAEGIRFESLLLLNQLSSSEQPAEGEKIYLQSNAPSKPHLMATLPARDQKPGQELILNKN